MECDNAFIKMILHVFYNSIITDLIQYQYHKKGLVFPEACLVLKEERNEKI